MNDGLEVTRGEGNVFRDFGYAHADAEHLKAVLAAQIIKALDARKLTVRKAEDVRGIAAADFSRTRNANPDRPTTPRLMAVLARLNQPLDAEPPLRPTTPRAPPPPPPAPDPTPRPATL